MDELLDLLRSEERLRALADTEMMDSPQEERFDRYTQLACKVLRAPVALVSLVDDKRQFFKSMVGLGEPWRTLRQTALSHSFCKHAVASGKPLIINDASDHPLVKDSPAVRDLGVFAYAGVPLQASGQDVGVLCVVDDKPHLWTKDDLMTLHVLAAAVSAELELTATRRELRESRALLTAITESSHDAILTIDSRGDIVFCNDAVMEVFGHERTSLHGQPFTLLLPEKHHHNFRDYIARGEDGTGPTLRLERDGRHASGRVFPMEIAVSRWSGRNQTFYTTILRDVSERVEALNALRATEEQLRLTIDSAAIGQASVAPNGRWLRVNEALCQIVGYSREELLQLDFQSITHPDDLDMDLALLAQLVEGKIPTYQLEKRYLHRAGHAIWISLSVSVVRNPDFSPAFFVAQIQDITLRRQAEAQASLFFESSRDLLAVFSPEGRFQRANHAWTRVLGWQQEDLLGHHWIEFIHPDDRDRSTAHARQYAGRPNDGAFRNRYLTSTGDTRWLEWSTHTTEEGARFGVARDITESMKLEEEIRRASISDELTGLHNRRGFMLLGEQLLRTAERYERSLFVLFADLNGLKVVNDTLGHDAGDAAIREMADMLRATFRKSDVLGRLGGDEFVVLAEGDASVAETLRARLDANLAAHNLERPLQFALSASVGVALYDRREHNSLNELIASADKLMYDAKRRRRSSMPRL